MEDLERDGGGYITNESIKFIFYQNKILYIMSKIPWKLRLRLIKILKGFMWDWGMVGVFQSDFIFYSTWNCCVSLYSTCTFQNVCLPVQSARTHSNFFLS